MKKERPHSERNHEAERNTMETERFITPTPTGEIKSSPARAIVEWPRGFDYPAVIYPIGGSYELDEAIRGRLEVALG